LSAAARRGPGARGRDGGGPPAPGGRSQGRDCQPTRRKAVQGPLAPSVFTGKVGAGVGIFRGFAPGQRSILRGRAGGEAGSRGRPGVFRMPGRIRFKKHPKQGGHKRPGPPTQRRKRGIMMGVAGGLKQKSGAVAPKSQKGLASSGFFPVVKTGGENKNRSGDRGRCHLRAGGRNRNEYGPGVGTGVHFTAQAHVPQVPDGGGGNPRPAVRPKKKGGGRAKKQRGVNARLLNPKEPVAAGRPGKRRWALGGGPLWGHVTVGGMAGQGFLKAGLGGDDDRRNREGPAPLGGGPKAGKNVRPPSSFLFSTRVGPARAHRGVGTPGPTGPKKNSARGIPTGEKSRPGLTVRRGFPVPRGGGGAGSLRGQPAKRG